jgi:RimJ/RimL family protein N-acetyltransferase
MVKGRRNVPITMNRHPKHARRDDEWVPLRDGRRVYIRSWQPDDQPEIAALFERLSPRSLAQRFHSAAVRITAAVLDQVTAGHALVAELDGQVVALASYNPLPDRGQADVGIVVDDAHQRRGIGTALCDSLARHARRAGIPRLRAEVLSSNYGMLRLLRGLRFPLRHTRDLDVEEIDVELCSDAA